MPLQCAIHSEGCIGPAIAFAPQEAPPYQRIQTPGPGFDYEGNRFIYLPICGGHLNGWLDGASAIAWPPVYSIMQATMIENEFRYGYGLVQIGHLNTEKR